jgi:hypothetical protein
VSDCLLELSTQHHIHARSKGVIDDDEELLFVVLDRKHIDASHLTADAFPSDRLKKPEASVARRRFTLEREVVVEIIEPALKRGKEFLGVAKAIAGDIRQLKVCVQGQIIGRAFCVVDMVEPGDFDGHGALSFSERLVGKAGSKPTLAALKPILREDLAGTFGAVTPLEAAYAVAPPAIAGKSPEQQELSVQE